MKKHIFIIVLLCLVLLPVLAQEQANSNRIGIGLGGVFGGLREEADSELNLYYTTLTYLIDANMERGDYLHTFGLGFYMGQNRYAKKWEDKYDYYWTYFTYRAYFEYGLDYRMWGNETFPGFLGGAFRFDFYLLEAIEAAKFFGALSLGIHVTQMWIISPNQKLVFSATTPLIGYAPRSPFPGADELQDQHISDGKPLRMLFDGKFASLHNYWALFGDIKYHYHLTSLITLNAGVSFEYSRINIPAPRTDAVSRVYAGISFTF